VGLKDSSEIIFNFNFNFKIVDQVFRTKRRHLGWHPRAQVSPNPEVSRLLRGVDCAHVTSEPPENVLTLT
jgi:hypothetical protein